MKPLPDYYRGTGTHYLQFKYNASAATAELDFQMSPVRRVYATCYDHIVELARLPPKDPQ